MRNEPPIVDDANPTPSIVLHEHLLSVEPPILDDDTSPSRSIDVSALVARDEPPIHDDDTNPSRSLNVAERLARHEPPISAEDTNPSLVTRPPLIGAYAPRTRGGGIQRWIGLGLLLIALVLATTAGLYWLDAQDDDNSPVPAGEALVKNPQNAGTASPSPEAETPQAPAVIATRPPTTPQIFPTAAADEIAVALMAPVGNVADGYAIPRQNEPFTIRPAQIRTEVVQYTVQEGDTLESIAGQFGLNDYYTLVWSNKSNKYSPLRPGNQLNILPEDGVFQQVSEPVSIQALADEYKVDPYTIIDAEYNDLFGSRPETLLPEGTWVVIPGGEAERALFLPEAAGSGTGSSSGGAGVLSGTYTLWGCTAELGGGSPPYGRPLGNYTWMRGFVPGGHTGVDLAGSAGDPVYAAGSGTVVYAGWSDGGYGNVIVLAHDTTFSLYGHLLRTGVNCGQRVSAGAVIGQMGSTGNSSGNHLHFEVRDADFNARNPQNWIGF
jgi:murein DD-endopeptidase MepM/ murein hydrolase activator NlpD